MSVGSNIKNTRKIMGFSQIELAEATGLSIATIRGYEQEKFKPKDVTLDKIAAALNIDVSDLKATPNDWTMFELFNQIRHLEISQASIDLIEEFNKLNETGQRVAVDRTRELTYIPEYKKAP